MGKAEKYHCKIILFCRKKFPKLNIILTNNQHGYPDYTLDQSITCGIATDDNGQIVVITPETLFSFQHNRRLHYTLRGSNNWFYLDENSSIKIYKTLKYMYQTYTQYQLNSIAIDIPLVRLVTVMLPQVPTMDVDIYPNDPVWELGWHIDHQKRLIIITPERLFFQRYANNYDKYVQTRRPTANWHAVTWIDEMFMANVIKSYIK